MDITTLDLDIAKNVFQLHGVDGTGQTVLIQRITRKNLASLLYNYLNVL